MAYDKIVDSAVLDGALQATADAIKDSTGTESVEWDRKNGFAAAVADVYDAGEMTGVETGKQAEYDRFWNAFHETAGTVYTHKFMFAGPGWNDNTFSPTFSIAPTIGEAMFRECRIVNLADMLERNGVTFDFSQMTSCDYFAYSSTITSFPFIDFSKAARLSNCFAYLLGENISLSLKISDSGSQKITGLFDNSKGLTELRLTGTVGQSGLSLQWSTKLSKESITSVINALSPNTSGLTVTFSKTAVTNAFSTDGDGLSVEWVELISTKPNWTFVLDSTAISKFYADDYHGNRFTFFFEQGMTWCEFASSAYNTDGIFEADPGTSVMYERHYDADEGPWGEAFNACGDVMDSNEDFVFAETAINAGEVYLWWEI